MTTWKQIFRSLFYYRKSVWTLMAGFALTCAIMVGALNLGHSVDSSLKDVTTSRLGGVSYALDLGSQTISSSLARQMEEPFMAMTAPVLSRMCSVSHPEKNAYANRIHLYGVDSRFWDLSATKNPLGNGPDQVVVNRVLAQRIGLHVGESIVLRLESLNSLPQDVILSKTDDQLTAIRVEVSQILDESDFGSFNLENSQVPPANIFMSLAALQSELDIDGQANLILTGISKDASFTPEKANQVLQKHWQLKDMGVTWSYSEERGTIDLKTPRIFFQEPLEQALRQKFPKAGFILSYLVNSIKSGERDTPYSIVSAIEGAGRPVIKNDQILLSNWCAEDLKADVGGDVTLSYFKIDQSQGLKTESHEFKTSGLYHIDGIVDAGFMPEYPGLTEADSCSEWESGMPMDMDRIRKKDEVFWEKHRGTPKALISFETAREIWGNKFGHLTSVRVPYSEETLHFIQSELAGDISPSNLGFKFIDLGVTSNESTKKAMGFGSLFIGFSFFIIVSAIALSVLLVTLQMMRRSRETGLLKAIGFSPIQIRNQFFGEIFLISIPAGFFGSLLGLLYCMSMIWAIQTVWVEIIGEFPLTFTPALTPTILGCLLGLVLTWTVVYFVHKKASSKKSISLLRKRLLTGRPHQKAGWLWFTVGFTLLIVGISTIWFAQMYPKLQAILFFLSGFCVLFALLSFCFILISWEAQPTPHSGSCLNNSRWRQAIKMCGLYPLRSMTVIGLVASGTFMVVAVDAYRLSSKGFIGKLESDTGGYALLARSTVPLGRIQFEQEAPEDLSYTAFRVKPGDDTSCLNLNRAIHPQILGIDPAMLQGHFVFKDKGAVKDQPWQNLHAELQDGEIPAIGNFNTLLYSLGVSVGGTIEIQNELGQTIVLRMVAALDNCIFQDGLLIAEKHFTRLFPSQSGYAYFLIQSAQNEMLATGHLLSETFRDFGLEVVATSSYLDGFNQVQNTYITIFQVLGALGLLIGTFGLAAILFRNILERQSEFALYHALGYSQASIKKQVRFEHLFLFVTGLAVGLICAVIAIAPRLLTYGVPFQTLILVPAGLFLCGWTCVFLATNQALKSPVLSALRRE